MDESVQFRVICTITWFNNNSLFYLYFFFSPILIKEIENSYKLNLLDKRELIEQLLNLSYLIIRLLYLLLTCSMLALYLAVSFFKNSGFINLINLFCETYGQAVLFLV